MKKTINTALIVITATLFMTGNINAKQLRRRPIVVTKNEKNILLETKKLVNSTPENEVKNLETLKNDLAKNPAALLLIQRDAKNAEIRAKENQAKVLRTGLYRDTDAHKKAESELIQLKNELKTIEEALKEARAKQTKEGSYITAQSVAIFVGVVGGSLIALQLLGGYDVTGTFAGGATTIANKIKSGAAAAWSYVPSTSDAWEQTKTAFGYGSSAVSVGFALLNAKDFAKRLSAEISDEKDKDNPDQKHLNELYEQLAEQNEKIAELEAKAAQTK